MNRIVCYGIAMFVAIVGIALIGGQKQAVAGGGGYVVSSCGGYVVDSCACAACQPVSCHGCSSCHGGGLFARWRAAKAARQCGCSGVVVSSCHCGGMVCGGVSYGKGGPIQTGPAQSSKGPVQHGKVMSYGPVQHSCGGYGNCCGYVSSCHGCGGPVAARHQVRRVRRCHGCGGCGGCTGWSCGGYYGGGVVVKGY